MRDCNQNENVPMLQFLASGRSRYGECLVELLLVSQTIRFNFSDFYLILVITKGCLTAAWAAFCAMLFCCCVIPSGA